MSINSILIMIIFYLQFKTFPLDLCCCTDLFAKLESSNPR